jgi:capsular polysaccharide biosynthesis protein
MLVGLCCTHTHTHRNLLSDLAYTRQADVLIGLHSDGLANAFFMDKHASVVEVRPRGFSGQAASQHMKVGCAHVCWGV